MREYLKRISETRYFWFHLAKMELRNKFRRSKLGILWTFISPLCLTLIMSFVFATVFNVELVTYAPYILAGMIFWDLINNSFVSGSMTIISSEAYIRQFNHPIAIYTLKNAIVYTITFLIALTSLVIWILIISPQNLIVALLSLPLTTTLFFLLSWAGTTIAAYTNTKYRDYPQMMPLIMQTLWYLSPVFFQEDMFAKNPVLHSWFNTNPITHMLFLLRKPFLDGEFPNLENYIVTISTILVIGLIAIIISKKSSKNIIFYI